jgi:hypothetical protein
MQKQKLSIKAAYEFEDLEKMVESAEKLYGPSLGQIRRHCIAN